MQLAEFEEARHEVFERSPDFGVVAPTLVPVVRICAEEVDVGIAGIPGPGVPPIGFVNVEPEACHGPYPLHRCALLSKDAVHCPPRIDVLRTSSVHDVGACLRLMVEGEPNLTVELRHLSGEPDHLVVDLRTRSGARNICPSNNVTVGA